MLLPEKQDEDPEIEEMIFILRGHRVMIDRDLARLYGVETKYLNRQVRRNYKRFPEEFVFQLSKKEAGELVTNWHRFKSIKHSSVLPTAFTEHGVGMLAGVLNSEQAVQMSVRIIKEFVRLRRLVYQHRELARRLAQLERKIVSHDENINGLLEAMHRIIDEPFGAKRKIGFTPD
ncbi:MAG: ORF6N domain-containing protein [Elusimicrobia bacterium]|nr:ORF6N domain-containing protein [Elusimicrobiota bacterium]